MDAHSVTASMADLAPASPSILYVDDEPQSIKYFTRAFGSEFRVLTAGSVAEAERILAGDVRDGSAGVGVLVTDQRMPVETGVQLLARVKERYPAIIRLLTTAYADLSDAVAAVNRGEIHRYVLKPWDIDALRADLRACLALHRERQAEQELLQARRQTLVGLASYMAHELATPLATIAGAAAGLGRHLPALVGCWRRCASADEAMSIRPEALEALESAPALIQESAERSRMLVRLLLMNAGVEGPLDASREQLSLGRLVDEALGCYPFGAGERDRVRVEGDDFRLAGPPALLVHVIHNLIKNALDAIHAAGKGDVRLVLRRDLDWNWLTITDTGIGIAPEVMPRIFDEFFSLKEPGRGTGMGLPFCQRVMTALGGGIACRSVVGEYTRVELRFPPIADRPQLDDVTPEDLPEDFS
ncbi:MAG: ATP-binding protein [Bdellovibrio bacteriovorus]